MDLMRKYTVDYIWDLPEGQRAELIDGVIYDMSAPSGTHQWIVMEVAAELRNFIRSKSGKCKVFPAPFAVYLNDNNSTYVEPDISVLCDMSKYHEDGIYGAPDLVIEVASPSTQKLDYGVKLFKYRTAGVREYWIINPENSTINTYHFTGDDDTEEASQHSFNDDVPFAIYPELLINIEKIMEGLEI